MNPDTLPESWRDALGPVLQSPRLGALDAWLRAEETRGSTIYPPRETRLTAFALTPLQRVQVVILGQDPYHGAGQAHGLAFSVPRGVKVPPSLGNIYKELATDLDLARPAHGHLAAWADAGVLLLNTVLTVAAARPASHRNKGWEDLTDAALAAVAARGVPCVFLLWGKPAQATAARIPGLDSDAHLVLTAPHPSPLSAYTGFLGCRHFSQANAFLTARGGVPVDWQLPA